MEAIRIEKVFDDPLTVRALVERRGPYRAMASYLPLSATRGDREATDTLPWFRGTWAANGRPLVDGAELILENPRFLEAASQLFNGVEVIPNTIAVNVNAPMPAGSVHVDIPSFRGATRDRYSIQLLQAMASSGLFEPWYFVEAGAVVWFYEGEGGQYDYWPDGLSGPMRSERQPVTNRALVADNDRMYHRIGRVGEPDANVPAISPSAQIAHVPGTGWVINDDGRQVRRYPDEEIRISILWKGRVRPPNAAESSEQDAPLTPEHILQIFLSDLVLRGVSNPTSDSPLFDQAWLDIVHSTCYSPIELPE
jgi:hypothetical protein